MADTPEHTSPELIEVAAADDAAPEVQPAVVDTEDAAEAEAAEVTAAPMDRTLLRKIVEGALLAAGQPLTVAKLSELFVSEEGAEPVPKDEIKAALEDIQADCDGRGFELKEVGSGWRFQVRAETAPWVNRLWDEKPQKYSRALLETLSLIAYRQPITRGDIEEIRGVAVSSHIIKTLSEREWIKVVGHRDVPGRPSLYATTRQFLDYFNLKSLDELPSLSELRDLDELNKELDLVDDPDTEEREGIEEAMAEVAGTDPEAALAEAAAQASAPTDGESHAEADLLAADALAPADGGAEETHADAPADESAGEHEASFAEVDMLAAEAEPQQTDPAISTASESDAADPFNEDPNAV